MSDIDRSYDCFDVDCTYPADPPAALQYAVPETSRRHDSVSQLSSARHQGPESWPQVGCMVEVERGSEWVLAQVVGLVQGESGALVDLRFLNGLLLPNMCISSIRHPRGDGLIRETVLPDDPPHQHQLPDETAVVKVEGVGAAQLTVTNLRVRFANTPLWCFGTAPSTMSHSLRDVEVMEYASRDVPHPWTSRCTTAVSVALFVAAMSTDQPAVMGTLLGAAAAALLSHIPVNLLTARPFVRLVSDVPQWCQACDSTLTMKQPERDRLHQTFEDIETALRYAAFQHPPTLPPQAAPRPLRDVPLPGETTLCSFSTVTRLMGATMAVSSLRVTNRRVILSSAAPPPFFPLVCLTKERTFTLYRQYVGTLSLKREPIVGREVVFALRATTGLLIASIAVTSLAHSVPWGAVAAASVCGLASLFFASRRVWAITLDGNPAMTAFLPFGTHEATSAFARLEAAIRCGTASDDVEVDGSEHFGDPINDRLHGEEDIVPTVSHSHSSLWPPGGDKQDAVRVTSERIFIKRTSSPPFPLRDTTEGAEWHSLPLPSCDCIESEQKGLPSGWFAWGIPRILCCMVVLAVLAASLHTNHWRVSLAIACIAAGTALLVCVYGVGASGGMTSWTLCFNLPSGDTQIEIRVGGPDVVNAVEDALRLSQNHKMLPAEVVPGQPLGIVTGSPVTNGPTSPLPPSPLPRSYTTPMRETGLRHRISSSPPHAWDRQADRGLERSIPME